MRLTYSPRVTSFVARLLVLVLLLNLALPGTAWAMPLPEAPYNATPQAPPFAQDWTNTGLITVNDDWSGVPGIMGYRGDDLTTATGTDPQTILVDGTSTPIDVNANQLNPNTFTTGGVTEFEIANPVVALQGSGTADAPFIQFYIDTTGFQDITVSYNLRDIDGSTDNAVQPVALHYRVGGAGNFTNLPEGFVADASTGPSLANLVTPVSVVLPTAADNQPLVVIRVMTTNAVGNDEWIGIDDINVTGTTTGGNRAVRVNCGGPLTISQGVGFLHPVNARDVDGQVTSLAVSNVAPPAAPGSITMTNVIPAPSTGLTATGQVSFTGQIPLGFHTVQVTASNNDNPTPQSASCNLNVQVITTLKIGQVQGVISDTLADPFTYPSPYVGQTVTLAGIVTDRMITKSSAGAVYYHFYLQERPQDSDGDARTSDGVHFFIGTSPSFSGYTPAIGDSIVVRGTVSEYFNDTELTGPALIANNGNVGNIDTAVPAVPISPTATITSTGIMYERIEGMRAFVTAGAPVVAPTHLYASTDDTEMYVIRPDHPVALRPNPYERRVFRDGHPLDYGGADGNPYRISIESQVLKGNAVNPDVDLPPLRTYDVVNNVLKGPIIYAFSRYTMNIEQQPVVTTGVDPSANNVYPGANRTVDYSVATFNVENLYDYWNDPFDNCDFWGDPGCPGVTPPFDYVPASQAEYYTHTTKLARVIVDHLLAPDVIAVQEAEDQDVCTGGGSLYGICGAVNDADGQPDVLQDLAWRIYLYSSGTISYAVKLDRVGADERGITVGFMWRTDRVQLPPASPSDPLLGLRPTDPYSNTYPHNIMVLNPKGLQAPYSGGGALFSRTPQVALFHIYRTSVGQGDYVPLYVIDNHFKSNPDTDIQRRTEQAQYNATLTAELLAAIPGAQSMVAGDLNVYPDSAQLAALYTDMDNLYYSMPPVANYSYVFSGQTQTLDQMFVTAALSATFQLARHTHIDADFPFQLGSDASVPNAVSDHDPLAAVYRLPALATPTPTPTNTPPPTATNTPQPTATNTPTPTRTNTPVPTATNTPVPTATNTPAPTATNTPVPTTTNTPVPTATNTPAPTTTNTPVPTATNTPVPTATNTPVPTATVTSQPVYRLYLPMVFYNAIQP
jgi:predicted extracellular nuclease